MHEWQSEETQHMWAALSQRPALGSLTESIAFELFSKVCVSLFLLSFSFLHHQDGASFSCDSAVCHTWIFQLFSQLTRPITCGCIAVVLSTLNFWDD